MNEIRTPKLLLEEARNMTVPSNRGTVSAVSAAHSVALNGSTSTDRITKVRYTSSLSNRLIQSNNIVGPNGKFEKMYQSAHEDSLFESSARCRPPSSNKLSSSNEMQSSLPELAVPHHPSPRVSLRFFKRARDKVYKSGPHLDPVCAKNSYCLELFEFASKNRLNTPQFVNFHRYNLDQNEILYMSCVKINEWSYSSMPVEHVNLNEVQEYAAKVALTDLIKRFAENHNLANLGNATDEKLIINRITEMVSDRPNGLKAEFIETKFRELFKEKLPCNWIEMIKSHKLISVENLINGFYLYPRRDIEGDTLNVMDLPPLKLPESNEWNIFVTRCRSSSDVHFRLLGSEYDEAYGALVERMGINYQAKDTDLQPAKTIIEGSYYAAYIDKHWHRVKILSGDAGNKQYRVSLVDHGDVDEVPSECIFQLDKDFTQLPAQALQCCLSGLEKLSENDYVSKKLNFVTRKNEAYVARVNARNPSLMLTLYDTSTDKDINVNMDILEKLLTKELRILGSSKAPASINSNSVGKKRKVEGEIDGSSNTSLSSRIPPFPLRVNEKLRVHVSMVTNAGHFIIQPFEYQDELRRMNAEMQKYYSVNRPQAGVNEIQAGNVFAVETVDKQWRRCMFIDVLRDTGELSLKCVDYGNIITVNFRMVCSLMPCFRRNPALAMEAKLAGIAPVGSHWSMQDCSRFHNFLVNKQFCGQVIEVSDDGVVSLVLTHLEVFSRSRINVAAQFVKEGWAIDTTHSEFPYLE